MYGPRGPRDAASHWRATSKCLYFFCSLMLTDTNPFVLCRSQLQSSYAEWALGKGSHSTAVRDTRQRT